MSALVSYWVKVPKITYEWMEVSSLSKQHVLEDIPTAVEVLTEEEMEEKYGD